MLPAARDRAASPDFSEGRFSKSFVGLAEGEDSAPSDSEGHQASVSKAKGR